MLPCWLIGFHFWQIIEVYLADRTVGCYSFDVTYWILRIRLVFIFFFLHHGCEEIIIFLWCFPGQFTGTIWNQYRFNFKVEFIQVEIWRVTNLDTWISQNNVIIWTRKKWILKTKGSSLKLIVDLSPLKLILFSRLLSALFNFLFGTSSGGTSTIVGIISFLLSLSSVFGSPFFPFDTLPFSTICLGIELSISPLIYNEEKCLEHNVRIQEAQLTFLLVSWRIAACSLDQIMLASVSYSFFNLYCLSVRYNS